MSRFANALKLALESDGVEESAIDVVPAAEVEGGEELEVVSQQDNVVVDTSDSAEEAVADVDAAEGEIATQDDQVEELEEAAAGLESIYDNLRAAAKKGPLSQDTLKFANIGIESYGNRIGMTEQMALSTEGRGNTVSLEGIKETIARAWEAIKALAIKIWTSIVNFIKRLFSAAERLEHRGRKLAGAKLGGTLKKKEIELKGLASKISVGKDVEASPAAGLETLINLSKAVAADAATGVGVAKSCMEVAELVASGNVSGTDGEARLAKATNVSSDAQKFIGKQMPGNKKLDRKEYSFSKFKYKTVAMVADGEGPDNATIKTLSPGEIKAAGEWAVRAAKAIKDLKTDTDKSLGEIKSFKKPTAAKDLSSDQAKVMREAQQLFRLSTSTTARMVSVASAHLLRTALAYVQVAEKSAAQYGKEEKKAA